MYIHTIICSSAYLYCGKTTYGLCILEQQYSVLMCTARILTRNLFHPKCAPIQLGHSDYSDFFCRGWNADDDGAHLGLWFKPCWVERQTILHHDIWSGIGSCDWGSLGTGLGTRASSMGDPSTQVTLGQQAQDEGIEKMLALNRSFQVEAVSVVKAYEIIFKKTSCQNTLISKIWWLSRCLAFAL